MDIKAVVPVKQADMVEFGSIVMNIQGAVCDLHIFRLGNMNN